MNRIVVYFLSIGLVTMASTGWGQQEGSAATPPPPQQSATLQPAAAATAPPTAQPGPAVGQAKAKGKKVKRSGSQSSFVQPTRPTPAPTSERAPKSGFGSRLPSSRTAATSAALGDCPECLANAQAACARHGQDSKNCSLLFGTARSSGSGSGSGSGPQGVEVGQ